MCIFLYKDFYICSQEFEIGRHSPGTLYECFLQLSERLKHFGSTMVQRVNTSAVSARVCATNFMIEMLRQSMVFDFE